MDTTKISTLSPSTSDVFPTSANPSSDPRTNLPDNYLDKGYYAITEKNFRYLRPEFVREYAKEIAEKLSLVMQPAVFEALVRELKRSKKRTLPFEARQTALYELFPKAKSFVFRGKAPQLLIDLVEASILAVKTDEDWMAMYRHFTAIAGYLGSETK